MIFGRIISGRKSSHTIVRIIDLTVLDKSFEYNKRSKTNTHRKAYHYWSCNNSRWRLKQEKYEVDMIFLLCRKDNTPPPPFLLYL